MTGINRIVRPNIENVASAKASGSFWSKYLLHKKRVLYILPEKCSESLYAVCEVLVSLIRNLVQCIILVKYVHHTSTSY